MKLLIKKKMKPIIALIGFELKLVWKKFISIIIVCSLIIILQNLFMHILNPNITLNYTQEGFISGNLMIFLYVITLVAGLLFSGIICSEYKNKTGLTLFPLISKGKILAAKYVANYILLIGTITLYYVLIILLDYYFYAEWIIPSILMSYGFVLLFSLALTSLISLFSSFLPSSVSVILIELVLILFGFDLVGSFISMFNYQIEPIFSLSYLFNIVSICLFNGFTNFPRYDDITEGGSTIRTWIYPDVFVAILVFIVYFVVCTLLTYLIFKRKQL